MVVPRDGYLDFYSFHNSYTCRELLLFHSMWYKNYSPLHGRGLTHITYHSQPVVWFYHTCARAHDERHVDFGCTSKRTAAGKKKEARSKSMRNRECASQGIERKTTTTFRENRTGIHNHKWLDRIRPNIPTACCIECSLRRTAKLGDETSTLASTRHLLVARPLHSRWIG